MMQPYVIFDWETRSARNLKTVGVEKYVECPHFTALCAGYQWAEGPARLWYWQSAPPADLCRHVAASGILVAHNAGFELAVWERMRQLDPRWPRLEPEQVRDTMAMGRAMGLPGALDDLANSLRLPVRKDLQGSEVMKLMCAPRKPKKGERTDIPLWNYSYELLQRLGQYCLIDVEVQHALYKLLPPLIPVEQDIFAMHERINARGVRLDVENAAEAVRLVGLEQGRLSAEISAVTGGKVTSANKRNVLLEWLDGQGVVIGSLRKTEVQRLVDELTRAEESGDKRREAARIVLELRQDASKSSTAKLNAMVRNACADGRARGLYSFYGANTGRSSGRRVQTQNLVRPPKHFKAKDAERLFEWLRRGQADVAMRLTYGSVMDPISWALRSFIVSAPGKRFVCADFSNIEGRTLAWLAGEEWKLDAFRAFDTFKLDAFGQKIPKKDDFERMGPDLYNVMAGEITGVEPDKVDEDGRQVMGKVPELACGFQGALGAFTSMGANYGVAVVPKKEDAPPNAKYVVTESEALEIVRKWRAKNSKIVQLWYDASESAMEAVRVPGRVTGAGKLEFQMQGDFLRMRLPSGRCLSYAYPSVRILTTTFWEREVQRWTKEIQEAAEEVHTEEGARRWGHAVDVLKELLENPDKREQLCFWGINSKSKNKKFGPTRAYGGLIIENATQATARDFQFHAGLRVERAGYPIVMHTHDELLAEVLRGYGSVTELAHIMCALPEWAPDIPISAAGWEGERYRK